MKVQVIESKPIPEGWTYKRCDIFTPEEFKEMYTNDKGNVSQDCLDYMRDNKKEHYTVSDKIAIREIAMQHEVGSMREITGRRTTKRYKYDHGEGWCFNG